MCVGSLQPDKEELSGENHPQLTIRLLSIPLSTVTFSFCQEIFALFFFLLLCRLFIGNKRSQLLATAGCSARGVIGLLRGDAQPSLYSILKVLVERGYNFGQVEGYDGHEEVVDKHSRFAAAYPPQVIVKNGDHFAPFSVAARLDAIPHPKKKANNVRAGMGCGCLATAPELNLKKFGASASTFHERGLLVPAIGRKPYLLPISKFNISPLRARFVYAPNWSKTSGVQPHLTFLQLSVTPTPGKLVYSRFLESN